MEYRKLVKFGVATFSVSLPKQWIREQKLAKGDLISIEENDDGSLRVSAKEAERTPEIKEISIDIGEMNDETVKRQILVSYINDYQIIHLRGNVRERIKKLREICQEFIALEILEVGPDRLTAKAFVDISETNPLKVLRRMDAITKTMFSEAHSFFEKPEDPTIMDETDIEVNRLHHFSLKLITRGLQDAEMARHWGFSSTDLAFLMIIFDRLEKICDRIKRGAHVLSQSSFSEAEKTLMGDHLKKLEENYRDAMTSFYKNDTAAANGVIERHRKAEKRLDSTTFACVQETRERVGCGVPMMLELLGRISTITEDIARTVLDLHPEGEQTKGIPIEKLV